MKCIDCKKGSGRVYVCTICKRKRAEVNRKERLRKSNKKAIDSGRAQAVRILAKAVKDGEIKKTDCHECGASKNLGAYAEIPDFDNPTIGVRWFCPVCYPKLNIAAQSNRINRT